MMLVLFGLALGRAPLVTWSEPARQQFQRIAGELACDPAVRVGLGLKRRAVMCGRRLAVAGHRRGIGVALRGDARDAALRLPGAHVLTWRDGRVVKDMVALPWAAHDAWAEFARNAVDQAASS